MKVVDPDGRISDKKLGGVKGGEAGIKIYYVKKSQKIIFTNVYVCICMYVYVPHVPGCPMRLQKGISSLELELHAVENCPKVRLSGRAIHSS